MWNCKNNIIKYKYVIWIHFHKFDHIFVTQKYTKLVEHAHYVLHLHNSGLSFLDW